MPPMSSPRAPLGSAPRRTAFGAALVIVLTSVSATASLPGDLTLSGYVRENPILWRPAPSLTVWFGPAVAMGGEFFSTGDSFR